MKKLLFATALLVGSATAASAQSTVVKVNIFSPLVKTGSFFVEHQVGEHGSVQLGGLFTTWGSGDTRLRGYAFTPEYRFYLAEGKPALQGFYVAPYLRYQHLQATADYQSEDAQGNATTEQARATLNTFGGGVVVGHQWIFRRRISLDAFLGPSYNQGPLRVEDTSSSTNENFNVSAFQGFGVRTGVTFGVAF